MSEDESINSDEIPSDKSSESSKEEENQDKALSNLKKTLNLEEESKEQNKSNNEEKNKNNKIYFFENTSIKEGEKNVLHWDKYVSLEENILSWVDLNVVISLELSQSPLFISFSMSFIRPPRQ